MSKNISGLDELLMDLDKYNNVSNNAVRKALELSGAEVERQMKMDCPVDTGNLRSSIRYEVNGDSVEIGTNVEYAPYVEYGTGIYANNSNAKKIPWSYQDENGDWHRTSGQPAHPFVTTALDKCKGVIQSIFKNVLGGFKP